MQKLSLPINSDVFGILTSYIQNESITDVDYNGSELWVTTTDNVRYQVECAKQQIEKGFLEKFTSIIANEVSCHFNAAETVLEAETETLRITMIHESVAVTGRSFCIRKSLPVLRFSVGDAISNSYASREVLAFLINCVAAKMNFVFCGEPAAGKTECAKFLSQFIPVNEKVITIEDNPELHYKKINPNNDAVEIKVNRRMDYTKAIKTSLRMNPSWLMLSEVRSTEARALLTCWSTGIKGFTTLHTDSVKKIPERLLNMMENDTESQRIINDIYSYVDVGVLLCKKMFPDGEIRRYIDQICLYTRSQNQNRLFMLVDQGKLLTNTLPEEISLKMNQKGITDYFANPAAKEDSDG